MAASQVFSGNTLQIRFGSSLPVLKQTTNNNNNTSSFQLTVRDVEEGRAENGWTEESEEYRRGDQIVCDVLPAHVCQTFAEYTEALA